MAVVAREFALDGDQVDAASRMALGILHGEGAWAWDADQLSWHCNELALTHRGRLLRLDRLVQHKGSGQWWVFDYKSNANPQQDPALCAQLLTYRSAVAQAYTGQTVRAAFLTPQGALIELPSA
jgi:ATP-dependent helicase/nuclease subunit A